MQKTLPRTLWWVMDGACSLAFYDLSARVPELRAAPRSKLNFPSVFRNAADTPAEQTRLSGRIRKDIFIGPPKFGEGKTPESAFSNNLQVQLI
jgi:hypothetical protein